MANEQISSIKLPNGAQYDIKAKSLDSNISLDATKLTGMIPNASNSGVRSITQSSSDKHKLLVDTGGVSTTLTITDNDTVMRVVDFTDSTDTTFNLSVNYIYLLPQISSETTITLTQPSFGIAPWYRFIVTIGSGGSVILPEDIEYPKGITLVAQNTYLFTIIDHYVTIQLLGAGTDVYLYNSGASDIFCEDITGGWYYQKEVGWIGGGAGVVQEDGSMRLSSSNTNASTYPISPSNMTTKSKIDLQGLYNLGYRYLNVKNYYSPKGTYAGYPVISITVGQQASGTNTTYTSSYNPSSRPSMTSIYGSSCYQTPLDTTKTVGTTITNRYVISNMLTACTDNSPVYLAITEYMYFTDAHSHNGYNDIYAVWFSIE